MSKINKMKNLELDSDVPDNSDNSDCDTCEEDEIATTFSTFCKLIDVKTTATNTEYILHIDATKDTNSTIAVATNESNVDIYNLSGDKLEKLETLTNEEGPCIGVKFNRDNSNLLYTGYTHGSVKVWDLRTPQTEVYKFIDTTAENASNKVFTCFDVSCNSRVLAAGTEVYKGDAYILFWDIRNVKLLGGYWESHTDDVTQTQFHPDEKDKLMSSSTDGLINIYDLSEKSEDDSLLNSLNTESSIEQLRWIKRNNGDDGVFCATHTFDVQLWGLEDAEPYGDFKRAELGKTIKRKSEDYSYVAGAHLTRSNELFLLVGSNYKDGECLRSLSVQKNQLKPQCTFTGNQQRVRSSCFNERTNTLITGGEKGILNIWKIEMS